MNLHLLNARVFGGDYGLRTSNRLAAGSNQPDAHVYLRHGRVCRWNPHKGERKLGLRCVGVVVANKEEYAAISKTRPKRYHCHSAMFINHLSPPSCRRR